MLLADVGAETANGWAGDVTRTWPVSGRYSSTQKDLYDVVLAAQEDTIRAVRPGVRYRDLHLLAARRMAEGLVALGIAWGLIVVALGMTQNQLLPGDFHWVIKVLHLLVGIAALGIAERLAGSIKRSGTPASQQKNMVPS